MGWMWKKETEENITTTRVVRSNCTIEEVQPGKFLRKCEKTEQILRDCVGRPAEVIESHTEHTEEDVTHEIKNDSSSLDISINNHSFSFGGFLNDIETARKELMGFFKGSEKMTGGLSKSLEIERNAKGNEVKTSDSEKKDESVCSEFDGKVRDV